MPSMSMGFMNLILATTIIWSCAAQEDPELAQRSVTVSHTERYEPAIPDVEAICSSADGEEVPTKHITPREPLKFNITGIDDFDSWACSFRYASNLAHLVVASGIAVADQMPFFCLNCFWTVDPTGFYLFNGTGYEFVATWRFHG